MKRNELDIQAIFLSVERDFSSDEIPKQKKRYRIGSLIGVLPSILGLAAFTFPIHKNSNTISKFAYNSLNELYKTYAEGLTELIQQLSF